MTFNEVYSQYDWDSIKEQIYSKTASEVLDALSKSKPDLNDFMALVSPSAFPYLEDMAQLSHQITKIRFGNTIQMYIPLYLSNECQNICTYCGFSLHNEVRRITLNKEQILQEVDIIKSYGYDHVLLVTGEANKTVNIDYFQEVFKLIRPYFSQISLEVQPLEQEEYEVLITLGLNAVLVYQETYNQDAYKMYHPKGKKSNFLFRLSIPDKLGKAGIHKIGLGTLIGIEDWRTDAFFTALHLNHLEKHYWKTKYTVSFPRLRPAEGVVMPKVNMNDKELVQLICAYRIFNENVELSLSTRENPKFRDNVIKLGITSMSAGSRTEPGGYAAKGHALEQFEISDDRPPLRVANKIKEQGYEPVWKDWDKLYN